MFGRFSQSVPAAQPKKKRKAKLYPEFPVIKFTVLGAAGVGKTSLIDSFVNNHFNKDHEPTREIEYFYRTFRYKPDPGFEKIQLGSVVIEFEDTYGSTRKGDDYDISRVIHNVRNDKLYQDQKKNVVDEGHDVHAFRQCSYTAMKKSVTPNKSAVLILYDVNDRRTLTEAQRLLSLLQERLKLYQMRAMAPFPLIGLVGTKIDEKSEDQDEIRLSAEETADTSQVHNFFVSAKSFEGVTELMEHMTKLVVGNPALWQLRDVDSDEYTDNSDMASSDDDDYVGRKK